MSRFVLGFFIGALVFNTGPTIEFIGSVAEVAKLAFIGIEETGSGIGERIVEELGSRGVLGEQPK
jgi:hypothetical protein